MQERKRLKKEAKAKKALAKQLSEDETGPEEDEGRVSSPQRSQEEARAKAASRDGSLSPQRAPPRKMGAIGSDGADAAEAAAALVSDKMFDCKVRFSLSRFRDFCDFFRGTMTFADLFCATAQGQEAETQDRADEHHAV